MTLYNTKNIIVLLITLVMYSCSSEHSIFSQEYIDAKQASNNLIKDKIIEDCPLKTDINKEILAATIYFDDFNSNLNKNDQNIITKVAYIQKKCSKALIIIGHSSNKESSNMLKSLDLSIERSRNVYNLLKQNKVNDFYLYTSACSNLSNLAPENNNVAQKYNQRVELIFTNQKPEDLQYICLASKNIINNKKL